jgi:hypothetical protein
VSTKNSIARLFLTGCTAVQQTFDCKVAGKALKDTALTVVGQIGANKGGVPKTAKLSLSYIIFSPTEAGFTSYGGLKEM